MPLIDAIYMLFFRITGAVRPGDSGKKQRNGAALVTLFEAMVLFFIGGMIGVALKDPAVAVFITAGLAVFSVCLLYYNFHVFIDKGAGILVEKRFSARSKPAQIAWLVAAALAVLISLLGATFSIGEERFHIWRIVADLVS